MSVQTDRPSIQTGLLTSLGLLCLVAASEVRADMLISQTTLVTGSESTVDSFTVPTAGSVTVELSNLPWPQALSSLSFTATSANQVLSSWSTQGTSVESLQLGPGTYFAHIGATTAGPLDLGLYSLTLSFQPTTVPLPSSGGMLGIALLVLLGLTRGLGLQKPEILSRP
jgi:hypothetical protein